MESSMKSKLLEVDGLDVTFSSSSGNAHAVKDAKFILYKGDRLGVVGESGSGKTVTSLSILNLLSEVGNNKTNGKIIYHSADSQIDLLTAGSDILRTIRGRRIAMIFQEPMSSLNPVRRCGPQVVEMLKIHSIGEKSEWKEIVLELFDNVALPDRERMYDSYPHELSGGQLQRINIAMALAADPEIIICDEPTTALDVTIQKEILVLLKNINEERGIALIFISHDLDVVTQLCKRVIVMYNGEIVEEGELPDTFNNPKHPYTKALMACKPTRQNRNLKLPTVQEILDNRYKETNRIVNREEKTESILKIENLTVKFQKKKNTIFSKKTYLTAVDDVSFELHKGEVLGIVGESGSGKSTIANCISGLVNPTSGKMTFFDQSLSSEVLSTNIEMRKKIQLIFQDPYSSLNPRMTIGNAIKEPLVYHKIVSKTEAEAKVTELLNVVGLEESFKKRYPHQLSGGQRQRVCIARALTVEPALLICDECVSALDVSIQAQILNLLDELRSALELSFLFISHDLNVVQYICDRILVMKEGKIVESGVPIEILSSPKHSYTQKLISSMPESFQ